MRGKFEHSDAAERAHVRFDDGDLLVLSWWQREWVRVPVVAAFLAAIWLVPDWLRNQGWDGRIALGPSTHLQLERQATMGYVGLALMPFMRLVSYRKRDALLIMLLPIWQWLLAAKIVYRLTFLPLRDWAPRRDEQPYVTRVARGIWVREHWPHQQGLPDPLGDVTRR